MKNEIDGYEWRCHSKVGENPHEELLCEGETRNRWRDGQVCPDVGQGTMSPWARRLGREKKSKKKSGEKRQRGDGRERGEREEEKKSGERTEKEKTRGVRDWSGKTTNAGGVENGI
ncbi:hypothetical protein TNCV_621231 [Trichonephila clavipes]|nr:hypothetical protein TNCV_621231 [Trichonephila clavipes]